MFTTLRRIIESGSKGFYRNFTISLSAILVLVISLISFASVYLASALVQPSIAQLEKKVDVNLYFETDALEEDIFVLQAKIEEISEVETVEYVSRDQALAEFKQRQSNQDFLGALDSIGENPLGAAFNIKAQEISQYDSIAAFLDEMIESEEFGPIIDTVNYNQNKLAIDKLNTIISSVQRFGIAASVLLVVLAVIITYNTVRLAIYTARNEIAVMRLVGASKFFTRGPFIVEGIFYGLTAGIISIMILWPTLYYAAPVLQEIFILNIYEFFLSQVFVICGSLLLAGMVMGGISSVFAIRRYLDI